MPEEPRITIIGAGRLGEALIRGLLSAGTISRDRLRATAATENRASYLRDQYGLRVTAGSNAEAVGDCEVLILGVKPDKVAAVLGEIQGALSAEHMIVSLAAAVPLEVIGERVPSGASVFRAMPNLAMTVGESATAICGNAAATEERKQVVEAIFRTVGSVEWVGEEVMNAVTGLSGSGPAFIFHVLEALTAGGEQAGLSNDVASRLVRQTLMGAARLAGETTLSPAEWIERVKTPGGTTVAGLSVLEEAKVRDAFVKAVQSAARRAAELTRE